MQKKKTSEDREEKSLQELKILPTIIYLQDQNITSLKSARIGLPENQQRLRKLLQEHLLASLGIPTCTTQR